MIEAVLVAMSLGSVGPLMQPSAASGGAPPAPTYNIVTLSGETLATLSGEHIRTIQDTP